MKYFFKIDPIGRQFSMNISCFCFCKIQVLRAKLFTAKLRRFVSETFWGGWGKRPILPLPGDACLHFRIKRFFSLWKVGWAGPQQFCRKWEFPDSRFLWNIPTTHAGALDANRGLPAGPSEPLLQLQVTGALGSDQGLGSPVPRLCGTLVGHLVHLQVDQHLRPFTVSDLMHSHFIPPHTHKK